MSRKKYHNMNPKERMAYWEKLREKDKAERAVKINKLSLEQRKAVVEVNRLLDSILDTALYPDMGGIKMVSAYDLQELSDANDTLQFQFNLTKGE